MNEKLRKYIVYACFGFAIIWGVYNLNPSDKSINKSSQLPPSVKNLDQTVIKLVAEQQLIDTLEMMAKKWGRDPFKIQRKIVKNFNNYKAVNNNLVLSGIIFNKSNPFAIINNKSFKTDDKIDNATIVKIYRDKVILNMDGKEITLSVTKGF